MTEEGAWREVSETANAMLERLSHLADKHPDARLQPEDYNALLKRAVATFPTSEALRDLRLIEGVVNAADLVGKLAIIHGAVKAAIDTRRVENNRNNQIATAGRRASSFMFKNF